MSRTSGERNHTLFTHRYVKRVTAYHAALFRDLIAAGELRAEDPDILAMMYASPVFTLLGVCDRQPDLQAECFEKLEKHVWLFFRTFHIPKIHGGNEK